jgi:two-component system, OmpR family, sensor kinase
LIRKMSPLRADALHHRMSLRSLRWQIQLWHAALLIVLVAVVLVVFYGYERRVRTARIDADLTGPVVAMLPRYIRLPGRPSGPVTNQDFEHKLEASGHYLIVLQPDGTTAYVSPDAPPTAALSEDQKPGAMFGRWNGAHRELVSLSPRGDIVIVALRDTRIAADLRTFTLKLAGLGLGVIALGLLGGHFIATRAIRPIRGIADSARRIASGHWSERIPASQAPVELEQLRAVLNDTFEQLAAHYERQRLFTADASHELGTPVAIVLAQTQHALARPRSPEEYSAALAACRRAGERMKALTRDLLDLASYDSGAVAPRRVECDLAEIARESLALAAPLAEGNQAELIENIDSVLARVDPLGLSQVLLNLVNNAILHNAAGVRVTLSVRNDGDHAVLTVEDNGRGIPPEALPHVFDRFFRAESARTREKGGSGLGLAIARQIVVLHEGTLTAENLPDGGARFTLRLPVPAPAP